MGKPRIERPQNDGGFGVLGHQPELMSAFTRLYGELWSRGIVSQPIKETVRLRNARVTDCRFCRNVRFAGARERGLSEDLVDLINDEWETSGLSPRHKAALRLADAFLAEPKPLAASTRAELLAHFSSAEIVELTAALALFVGFSKIAVALDTAPDSMPTTVLPTPA